MWKVVSGQLWSVTTNYVTGANPPLLHRLVGKMKWSGGKRWRPRVNKMAAVGSTWQKFIFFKFDFRIVATWLLQRICRRFANVPVCIIRAGSSDTEAALLVDVLICLGFLVVEVCVSQSEVVFVWSANKQAMISDKNQLIFSTSQRLLHRTLVEKNV